MIITDPAPLLEGMDMVRLQEILCANSLELESSRALRYVEPGARSTPDPATHSSILYKPQNEEKTSHSKSSVSNKIITGKVQTLGDFIDTDALAPSEALLGNSSAEEIGKYCLYHTHPDFRRRVKEDGLNIVVAGKAFGVGSSRENAVTALQGAGVQCVIARSFAFIYARNQPNLGMLGIVMEDESFYGIAKDGADIEIDVNSRTLTVDGKKFEFSISQLEIQLWEQGGMSAAFAKWGKGLLEAMIGTKTASGQTTMESPAESSSLAW